MKRSAHAVWQGGIKVGSGHLTTQSRTLAESGYSFATRFEQASGTNPEELMAAAHAGCFSMALAFILESRGMAPERIATSAELSVENSASMWTLTGVHLNVTARVPGVTDADFQAIADQAKSGCLVTRALNAPVTMSARLET